MWTRMFPSALPTPLHSEDVRHKNVRKQLLDEDEDDARPPLPKKCAQYSMYPIFDKYKRRRSNDSLSIDRLRGRRHNRASLSPIPESPVIEELKRNYATLRVTLHSNAVKDISKTEDALSIGAEEKINANLSKLSKIGSTARQLCASSLDYEVDVQVTKKNGQQKTRTHQVKVALSKYQDLETKRSKQLVHLWSSWEKIQTDIEELSRRLRVLIDCEPANRTSGMSSNREWSDNEDLDIDRRSKQVVEDMTACEEEFQEKLKDEEANILEAMLKCSLG
ncbi:hypothetical protein O1611_g483 [Lasiodiplodia mahajangana]|uniref:Uncharacterized protein n=1 Tax=Lasiodiplodia mahajangana TaxID=1108764 RepID=A0ACC2K038_9PEZI|nr:hypothetical protein O1611_g483 [Lasiodiplodia mahajangana]